ncbi:MAG: hypothetical protein EZS28_004985 [Streblomastix strix]|uniref:Uncharacterized protein n=1 Tax=Streblomastix strix TaxID=222440 RepID=A0A5J4WWR8_9EUKA|nr:MAG: hypothetical protein EZS28_004985 [Streblomastix strix]
MQGYFEIQCGLNDIYYFLRDFHYGRNFYSSFPLLPILAKTCLEQIEEEGGNEEVETQINNTRYGYQNTKYEANRAKAEILNYYIDRSNTRPRWYQ